MTVNSSNFTLINATAADRQALDLSLAYLQRDPNAARMLQQAVNGVMPVIDMNHVDFDTVDRTQNGLINTVHWDPNSAMVAMGADGKLGVMSAALGLFHEIAHLIDPNFFRDHDIDDPQYGKKFERNATEMEVIVAQGLGEVCRVDHKNLGNVYEKNSTEHTRSDGKWTEMASDGRTLVGATSFDFSPYVSSGGGGGGGGGGYYPYGDPF